MIDVQPNESKSENSNKGQHEGEGRQRKFDGPLPLSSPVPRLVNQGDLPEYWESETFHQSLLRGDWVFSQVQDKGEADPDSDSGDQHNAEKQDALGTCGLDWNIRRLDDAELNLVGGILYRLGDTCRFAATQQFFILFGLIDGIILDQ